MAVKRNKNKGNFLMINNDAIRNKKLSLKAKGLLALMLSFSEDWQFRLEKHLIQLSKDGEKATRSALKELINNGYVKKIITRNEDGQFEYFDYLVFENPQKEPQKEL